MVRVKGETGTHVTSHCPLTRLFIQHVVFEPLWCARPRGFHSTEQHTHKSLVELTLCESLHWREMENMRSQESIQ